MGAIHKFFCAMTVASVLYADFRGITLGSLMPWSSTRRYANTLNHK